MLDQALVALGRQEVIGDGGARAECLGWEERVDLARDALVAEGTGGGLLEGGRERSLGEGG